MKVAICAFEEDADPGAQLAAALGLTLQIVAFHRFPDGEGLPIAPDGDFDHLIVYRSLARPDPNVVPLLLLADAARRQGRRLTLVAPYMPYLRQDAVFRPGQPLSRDVIGRLLGAAFDTIVTVHPHLHRTASLTPVFAPASIDVIWANDLLAQAIGTAGDPIIVGPDSESGPWARAVAAHLGSASVSLTKTRLDDRHVRLSVPDALDLRRRRVVLIDDICSTGQTLRMAVRCLRESGAAEVEVYVVHALVSDEDLSLLAAEGVSRFASTDGCPHHTNEIALASRLARQLRISMTCRN